MPVRLDSLQGPYQTRLPEEQYSKLNILNDLRDALAYRNWFRNRLCQYMECTFCISV